MPLYRFLNVVYAALVAHRDADGREELDAFLDWPSPHVVADTEQGAPDWWRGEEAEALAMMAQIGASRG